MSNRCLNCCIRRGLTLIEVVTALAILSTLLVGILVAFKKNAEHIRTKLATRQAATAVDKLLSGWAEQGLYPPEQERGDLPGVDGFTWETRVVSREYRNTLGLNVVRLRVHAEPTSDESTPVLAIDLPVPTSPDPIQETPRS